MSGTPTTETPDDPIAALRKRSRILDRLLDENGRVARWPRRRAQKLIVLDHLAQHFDPGARLRESEVNALLLSLHAFNDAALLRRWLVEEGYLDRTRDGSAYWLRSEAAS